MAISKIIKERLTNGKSKFFCNDNISSAILPGELSMLEDEVTLKMQGMLDSLVIDTANDHNTKETARRIAKMMIHETFQGRYYPEPKVTSFPNASDYKSLYVTGPITIRSTCAHHFAAITGKAYIGVFPGTEVIGLSKFNRLVDWIVSRPTIQEEMSEQIADLIEERTKAAGVAVYVQAEHGCLTLRGVKEHASCMTTSVMRGLFRTDPNLKSEFMSIIAKMP